jgi:hypothetical protein
MNEIELLKDLKKSNREIADILQCSIPTVVRKRKKYDIPHLKKGRPSTTPDVDTTCLVCNTKFHYRSKNKRFCTKECYWVSKKGIAPVSSLILKNMNRDYMKTEEYSKAKSKEDVPAYRRYAGKVARKTEKIYEQYKDEINPDNLKRTRAGIEDGYQLDHIISVRYGFDNGISIDEIARLENLRIIPWKENLLKGKKNGEQSFLILK